MNVIDLPGWNSGVHHKKKSVKCKMAHSGCNKKKKKIQGWTYRCFQLNSATADILFKLILMFSEVNRGPRWTWWETMAVTPSAERGTLRWKWSGESKNHRKWIQRVAERLPELSLSQLRAENHKAVRKWHSSLHQRVFQQTGTETLTLAHTQTQKERTKAFTIECLFLVIYIFLNIPLCHSWHGACQHFNQPGSTRCTNCSVNPDHRHKVEF